MEERESKLEDLKEIREKDMWSVSVKISVWAS
jgi:hypothetical protein